FRAGRSLTLSLPLTFSSNTLTQSGLRSSCWRRVSCLLVLTRTSPTSAIPTSQCSENVFRHKCRAHRYTNGLMNILYRKSLNGPGWAVVFVYRPLSERECSCTSRAAAVEESRAPPTTTPGFRGGAGV